MSSQGLPRELLRLKKRTSWSWAMMSQEFQKVMGRQGPSVTTIFRYASGKPRRYNPMLEQYVAEALQRIQAKLKRDSTAREPDGHQWIRSQPQQNEAGFRLLVEQAPDILYRYVLAGVPRFDYISPAVQKILGFEPQEFCSDPELILRIAHSEDRPLLREFLLGRTVPEPLLRVRFWHKGGLLITTASVSSRILDPEGRLTALEGIIRDVTRENERETSRNHQAAIIQSSQKAVISCGLGGEILSWNRAAERLFGYREEEVLGRLTSILHPPEGLLGFLELPNSLSKEEPMELADVIRQTKEGRRIRVSIQISPIRDPAGTVIGLSGVVQERKPGSLEVRSDAPNPISALQAVS